LKKNKLLLYFFAVLSLASCAKRGSISGGIKDTIPPVLKSSFPKNFNTEFSGNTIKLSFDEYVKLKNINKQLVISPPLSKNPQILPLNASKFVTITFLDSLRPNTTYCLNFGQAIEDNNEGNPLSNFKYVFSTGTFIDSLSIKGNVGDALEKKISNVATIMLYELNEKHNDSAVYKKNPSYIAFSDEKDASFKIENIKAGQYYLVAVEDKASNYRFDPKTEKIAFRKNAITIPNDSVFELKMFKEIGKFQINKPTQSSGCSATIGYEGDIKGAEFKLRKGNNVIPSVITKIPKKDSLQIWFNPLKIEKSEVDSLHLSAVKGNYSKDYTFKVKAQKHDSLSVTSLNGRTLSLQDDFLLRPNLPLAKVDESKISLQKKDSTSVPFKVENDILNMTVKILFQKEPLEQYRLRVQPESFVDFIGQTNRKPFEITVETKNISDYGNLRLTLENVKQFPIIIELTDKDGNVKYSFYSLTSSEIDFNLIEPNQYSLRVIYDTNSNKIWDSGNYLEKRQPEDVIHFPKDIDVRANWDVQQTFSLSK
jgi:hypothetical protein